MSTTTTAIESVPIEYFHWYYVKLALITFFTKYLLLLRHSYDCLDITTMNIGSGSGQDEYASTLIYPDFKSGSSLS